MYIHTQLNLNNNENLKKKKIFHLAKYKIFVSAFCYLTCLFIINNVLSLNIKKKKFYRRKILFAFNENNAKQKKNFTFYM